jgi:hypothetical protein
MGLVQELRFGVDRVNRRLKRRKDNHRGTQDYRAERREREWWSHAGFGSIFQSEILVKNISGPEEMPTDSGSFDCVRLAPHFAQEDRDKK